MAMWATIWAIIRATIRAFFGREFGRQFGRQLERFLGRQFGRRFGRQFGGPGRIFWAMIWATMRATSLTIILAPPWFGFVNINMQLTSKALLFRDDESIVSSLLNTDRFSGEKHRHFFRDGLKLLIKLFSVQETLPRNHPPGVSSHELAARIPQPRVRSQGSSATGPQT